MVQEGCGWAEEPTHPLWMLLQGCWVKLQRRAWMETVAEHPPVRRSLGKQEIGGRTKLLLTPQWKTRRLHVPHSRQTRIQGRK